MSALKRLVRHTTTHFIAAGLILALTSLSARADGIDVVDDRGNVYFLGGFPSGDGLEFDGSFGLPMTDIAYYSGDGFYGVTGDNMMYRLGIGMTADLSGSVLPDDHLNALVAVEHNEFYAAGTLGQLYRISGSVTQLLGFIGGNPFNSWNSGGDLERASNGHLLWANSNGDLWDINPSNPNSAVRLHQFTDESGKPLPFDGLASHDIGGPLFAFFGNQSEQLYDSNGTWFAGPQYPYYDEIRGATFVIPEPSTLAMSSIWFCAFGAAWSFRWLKRSPAVANPSAVTCAATRLISRRCFKPNGER